MATGRGRNYEEIPEKLGKNNAFYKLLKYYDIIRTIFGRTWKKLKRK